MATRAHHQLSQSGTYFVTASTLDHEHHFRSAKRLDVLQRGLLALAYDYGWRLEAWAVFSNHYHFVAHSPEDAKDASNLSTMLNVLHSRMGGWINGLDDAPERVRSGSTFERLGSRFSAPISRASITFIRTRFTIGLFRRPISIRGVLRRGWNDLSRVLW